MNVDIPIDTKRKYPSKINLENRSGIKDSTWRYMQSLDSLSQHQKWVISLLKTKDQHATAKNIWS